MESLRDKVWHLVKKAFAKNSYDNWKNVSSQLKILGPQAVPHIVNSIIAAERFRMIREKTSAPFHILDVLRDLALPDHAESISRLIRVDSLYAGEERSSRCKIIQIFEKIGDKKLIPHFAEFRRKVRRVCYRNHYFNEYDYYRGRYRHEYMTAADYRRMDEREMRKAILIMLKRSAASTPQVQAMIKSLFGDNGSVDAHELSKEIAEIARPKDIDFAVEELLRRMKNLSHADGSTVFSLVYTIILPKALSRHAEGLCRVLISDIVAVNPDASTRNSILDWLIDKVRDPSLLPYLVEYRRKIKKIEYDRKLAGFKPAMDRRVARLAIKAILSPPGTASPKRFSI